MRLPFDPDKRLEAGNGLLRALRNIHRKKQSLEKAKKILGKWYPNIGEGQIGELITAHHSTKEKEDFMHNYVNNRSSITSAESLTCKLKEFRAQVRSASNLPFFMNHVGMLFVEMR